MSAPPTTGQRSSRQVTGCCGDRLTSRSGRRPRSRRVSDSNYNLSAVRQPTKEYPAMAAIIHAGRRLTDWLYELIRTSRFSVLAALGMVTFLLGFFGFRAYYIHLGDPRRWDDLVYLTVQLFVMESGSVPK